MSKKPRLVRVKEKIKVHQSNIKEISSPEVIKANERLDNLSSGTSPGKKRIKDLKTEEVKAI